MNEPHQIPSRGSLLPGRLKEARWQVALLACLVFAALLVLLPSIAKYHGDECFYTDAAIRMLQTGDYGTPYAANGALRFAKPILPYWGVLAGYFVFGINYLSSRLVFLLAGCVIIFLTYRLSIAVFNREREAVLAALIMASNVQLLTISIRSTPDALLCLFVLTSLLGFARLLFTSDTSWKNYALAYMGAGLAVQTRGLPGVGVVVFPFLYWVIFWRAERRLSQLLEWKAILLGLVVGCSWFALMLWLHGRALIDGFYYDQVTVNVRGYQSLDTLKNLQAYLVGVLRHFLPWTALLLIGLGLERQAALQFWREHRSNCWFLLGWFLFILAPFVFGGFYRTRYMIVAYPLLAVLLAGLLGRFALNARFESWTLAIIRVGAIVLALLGVALGAAGAIIQPRILVGGILFLVGAAAIWALGRRSNTAASWLALAGLCFVPFWVTEVCLRPVFAKSPAPALTAKLLPDDTMRARVYALNLSPSVQAQMRVLSGGRLTVVPLPSDSVADLVTGDTAVVLTEPDKSLVSNRPGVIEQVGFASGKWRARDFADLLKASTREAAYSRNLVPYFVLLPEPPKRSAP